MAGSRVQVLYVYLDMSHKAVNLKHVVYIQGGDYSAAILSHFFTPTHVQKSFCIHHKNFADWTIYCTLELNAFLI